MLSHLTIRNIVLIETLALDFHDGLCVLTGETGAGKSILLDALGLLRGERADLGLIRKDADRAEVSAAFDIASDHPVRRVLNDQGVGADEQIILRRQLLNDGRSRAFINDQSVTVGLLREVGRQLIDLHGQFDTGDLFTPTRHRDWLDEFAGLTGELEKLGAAWGQVKAARAAFGQAVSDAEIARREQDYLREAVEALRELAVEAGEEEKLVAKKAVLSSRAQILEGLEQVAAALSGDGGAAVQLAQAARVLDKLRPKITQQAEAWLAKLDTGLEHLRDVAADVEAMMFEASEGDGNLEAIDDRLYTLRAMARRHGCAVEGLPNKLSEMEQQLDLIDHGAATLAALEQRVKETEAVYLKRAREISDKRKVAAKKLDQKIMKELPPLKLERAVFATAIETVNDPAGYGPLGLDQVRFLVATNPGAAPAPLDKVASGGELSRLMLAIKVVLAEHQNAQACMIFDEVDSGIGGAVAAAVGERLARLSSSRQVLVVTHAPQVAALADQHWMVKKSANGNRAVTMVEDLADAKTRREEIARMLSGERVTDEARAAAQKLLDARVA